MTYKKIIGRNKEIAELEYRLKTDKSEFIAIYGRRRVGKSFLVNEVYKEKIAFAATGTYLRNDSDSYESYRKTQLEHFYDSLVLYGLRRDNPVPSNWREAFLLLRNLLEGSRKRRKVLFLDELPWLAGVQSSELVAELGYFWNSWADKERNIVLVVCGSATSWMLNNVIHDYGGLHGRLTLTIKLKQFSLVECEAYFKKHGFRLSRYEICLTYMATGGIPYYLDRLRPDLTSTENIDNLFFGNEMIRQEFKDVYTGLYSSKERYIDIVKAIGGKFYGATQDEIVSATGVKSGGTLTNMLSNLEESDIIRKYPRYGKTRVEYIYQLTDFFSLFFLRFIENRQPSAGRWKTLQRTPEFYVWAGDTFELLCIEHMDCLTQALGISSVNRNYCWRGKDSEGNKAQIDLILEWNNARVDYLCEMKFSERKFRITEDYSENLEQKISVFEGSRMHKKTHSIQLVMITTFGLTQSEHNSNVNTSLTIECLFK